MSVSILAITQPLHRNPRFLLSNPPKNTAHDIRIIILQKMQEYSKLREGIDELRIHCKNEVKVLESHDVHAAFFWEEVLKQKLKQQQRKGYAKESKEITSTQKELDDATAERILHKHQFDKRNYNWRISEWNIRHLEEQCEKIIAEIRELKEQLIVPWCELFVQLVHEYNIPEEEAQKLLEQMDAELEKFGIVELEHGDGDGGNCNVDADGKNNSSVSANYDEGDDDEFKEFKDCHDVYDEYIVYNPLRQLCHDNVSDVDGECY
jgi:hypothetical protein